MTSDKAKRVVLGAMITVGLVAVARDLTAGQLPKLTIVIGATVVAALLSALADAAPDLASSFALLVLLTALLTAGADTITAIGDAIGTGRTSTPLTDHRTGSSQAAVIGDALVGHRPPTR